MSDVGNVWNLEGSNLSMATLMVTGLRVSIRAQNMGWRRSRHGRPDFHGVYWAALNGKFAIWTAQECGVGSPAWDGH